MQKRFFPIFLLLNLAVCLSAVAVDRINVTDYGAVPDEAQPGTDCDSFPATSGCDDTTAIYNAVNAAGNGAKSIYFPPGTYRYTSSIILPANTSYRLYGDGPGVSTIVFTGAPYTGIYGPTMGSNTLMVDGLTLKANSKDCGTGIYAVFSETPPSTKFHTATIQNVQIIGSTRTGATGSYWSGGIYLKMAQNTIIDKVEINGNNRDDDTGGGRATRFGIIWESSNEYQTTGLQMSNLEMTYCDTALQTNGWVSELFLTGFEFVLCGTNSLPAIDLYSPDDANVKSTFHVVNGHVNALQNGIRATNLRGVKISKVFFIHSSGNIYASGGDVVAFNNCTDVVFSQCSFEGVGSDISAENGINLSNAHSVRIDGNYFRHMLPRDSGSCIAIQYNSQSNSSEIRITDNLFQSSGTGDGVRQRYDDAAPDTYYWGNN